MKTSVIQGFSILLVLYAPAAVFAGQALVALHRRNDNLDAVASRASKNVAVRGLCKVYTSSVSISYCLGHANGGAEGDGRAALGLARSPHA